MTNDPKDPEYNSKARDAIMDLCLFYDLHHKCGVVRENVFKDCLAELRERERLALESVRHLDALSNAGMKKILQLESRVTVLSTALEAALSVLCHSDTNFMEKRGLFSNDKFNEWKALLSENI